MKLSAVVGLSIAVLVSSQATPPKGGRAILCAAKCIAPVKDAGCKLDGIFPPKGDATGVASPAGKPPGTLFKREGGMAGLKMHKRQGTAGTALPKLSPEQQVAAKAARECFCGSSVLKGAQPCVTTSCASATDGGAAAVKGLNAICQGVAGYTPLTAATPAAGGAAPPL